MGTALLINTGVPNHGQSLRLPWHAQTDLGFFSPVTPIKRMQVTSSTNVDYNQTLSLKLRSRDGISLPSRIKYGRNIFASEKSTVCRGPMYLFGLSQVLAHPW